jgi:hypothetical protein
VVDGSKARAELGYRPRPVADTFSDFVAFMAAAGQLTVRSPHAAVVADSVAAPM